MSIKPEIGSFCYFRGTYTYTKKIGVHDDGAACLFSIILSLITLWLRWYGCVGIIIVLYFIDHEVIVRTINISANELLN